MKDVKVTHGETEVTVTLSLADMAVIVGLLGRTTGTAGYELYAQLAAVLRSDIGEAAVKAIVDVEGENSDDFVEAAGLA